VVVALTAAGGTIGLLVGAVLLRLTLTGTYRRYVRVEMGPWLAVAGVVVVVLGLVTLARVLRRQDVEDAHGHGRGGDRAGWLLLAPIAALLLVAPPTLGSYGVGRAAAVDIRAGAPVFRPLSGAASPVPMTLLEFGQRAFERDGASFADASVRLTGFVAGPDGEGFRLARYQIACCAADAAPVVIRVIGVHGGLPPRDRWVIVTGRYEPGGGSLPQLAATTVTPIPPPDEPYE
jgi:uncharacterized repeat protein (TIGR03943 family)